MFLSFLDDNNFNIRIFKHLVISKNSIEKLLKEQFKNCNYTIPAENLNVILSFLFFIQLRKSIFYTKCSYTLTDNILV